nr:extensin-like [Aegilops tauschii subsp. strangulata]
MVKTKKRRKATPNWAPAQQQAGPAAAQHHSPYPLVGGTLSTPSPPYYPTPLSPSLLPPRPDLDRGSRRPRPPTRSLSPSPTPPLDAHPQRRPAFLHSFPTLCWIRAIPIAPDPDPASPALALTSASHRRPTATAFPDAPDPPAMEAPCARSFTSSRTAPPLDAWNRTTPPPRSLDPRRPELDVPPPSTDCLLLVTVAPDLAASSTTMSRCHPLLAHCEPRALLFPLCSGLPPPSSFATFVGAVPPPPAAPSACLYALPRAGRAQRLTPLRPLRRALAPPRRGLTAVASGGRPRRALLSPVPLWWPRACVPAPAPKTTMAPWGL